MQKKLMLSIQGTYAATSIILSSKTGIIRKSAIEREKSSAGLVPLIKNTLKQEGVSVKNLSYIAVDQGPGAFISLRVSIVTANALAFCSDIPLIGIGSLEALINQVRHTKARLIKESGASLIVALLNAYSRDVYATYCPIDKYRTTPSMQPASIKIDALLRNLTPLSGNHKILFTGNGTSIHKETIIEKLGKSAIFEPTTTDHCSVETIERMARSKIASEKIFSAKLSPIYLKNNMVSGS